jgi:hypothetical protein
VLRDARWCDHCRIFRDRDVNAAENIMAINAAWEQRPRYLTHGENVNQGPLGLKRVLNLVGEHPAARRHGGGGASWPNQLGRTTCVVHFFISIALSPKLTGNRASLPIPFYRCSRLSRIIPPIVALAVGVLYHNKLYDWGYLPCGSSRAKWREPDRTHDAKLRKYSARYLPSTTAKVVPLSCSTYGSMAKKGTDFLESLAKHIVHTRCSQSADKLRGGPEAVRMKYSKQLRTLSEIICIGILRGNACMLSTYASYYLQRVQARLGEHVVAAPGAAVAP